MTSPEYHYRTDAILPKKCTGRARGPTNLLNKDLLQFAWAEGRGISHRVSDRIAVMLDRLYQKKLGDVYRYIYEPNDMPKGDMKHRILTVGDLYLLNMKELAQFTGHTGHGSCGAKSLAVLQDMLRRNNLPPLTESVEKTKA